MPKVFILSRDISQSGQTPQRTEERYGNGRGVTSDIACVILGYLLFSFRETGCGASDSVASTVECVYGYAGGWASRKEEESQKQASYFVGYTMSDFLGVIISIGSRSSKRTDSDHHSQRGHSFTYIYCRHETKRPERGDSVKLTPSCVRLQTVQVSVPRQGICPLVSQ